MNIHKYTSLKYIIDRANNILLVAHSRPDPDAIGANIALLTYLKERNIPATLTCYDDFPSAFDQFLPSYTVVPADTVALETFDVIIGADNINRGFDTILKRINPAQHTTIGIDHHLHTDLHTDLLITDPSASSTCEILRDFFSHIHYAPSTPVANALLIGILGDTRLFHNPNTSARVLEAAADLVEAGAPLSEIVRHGFLQKRVNTLKLWGIALRNARRLMPSSAIVSVITHDHIVRNDIPKEEVKEELKEVASLLASIPNIPFAMVLIEIERGIIKGSIRAERSSNTDTTRIAALFGGGGHRLASGFEVPGTIIPHGNSWQIAA